MSLLALAACDAATSPGRDDKAGRVSFDYTIANVQSGAFFHADGARPADGGAGTWAASAMDDADVAVYAQHERGAAHGEVVLSVPGGTAATSAIVPDRDDSCASVR